MQFPVSVLHQGDRFPNRSEHSVEDAQLSLGEHKGDCGFEPSACNELGLLQAAAALHVLTTAVASEHWAVVGGVQLDASFVSVPSQVTIVSPAAHADVAHAVQPDQSFPEEASYMYCPIGHGALALCKRHMRRSTVGVHRRSESVMIEANFARVQLRCQHMLLNNICGL